MNINLKDVIEQLFRFSNKMLRLGKPINDSRMELFETKYGVILPVDFKYFMRNFNGLNMGGTEVFPFDNSIGNSMEETYQYEHFETVQPQYKELVPFSPDGGGNFYCLDTSKINKDVPTKISLYNDTII